MDSNTTITLEVSVIEDDIDRGKPGVCEACPIARAVSRATGKRVSVDEAYIAIVAANHRVVWVKTPPVVAHFIRAFDGAPDLVKPFTFTIDVPAYVLESEAA